MEQLKKYVSRETSACLEEFIKLIRKWNRTINLVSKNSLEHLMQRHIIDSLQLLNYLREEDKIIDFGSGGGFPALILSIAGIKDIILIESDLRKTHFLQEAAKLSKHKIQIINDRIENIDRINCDVITARGFANLNKIFELSDKRVILKKKYLLLKGASYQQELDMVREKWLFNVNIHNSVTSDDGKILEISDLKLL